MPTQASAPRGRTRRNASTRIWNCCVSKHAGMRRTAVVTTTFPVFQARVTHGVGPDTNPHWLSRVSAANQRHPTRVLTSSYPHCFLPTEAGLLRPPRLFPWNVRSLRPRLTPPGAAKPIPHTFPAKLSFQLVRLPLENLAHRRCRVGENPGTMRVPRLATRSQIFSRNPHPFAPRF